MLFPWVRRAEMVANLFPLVVLVISLIGCVGEKADSFSDAGSEEEGPSGDPRNYASYYDNTYGLITEGEGFQQRFPINDPCGLPFETREHGYFEGFLYWTPNGDRLVVDDRDLIVALGAVDGTAETIVDTNPVASESGLHGLYADISPDGSHLVYSSCEFPIRAPNYEIVVRGIDGTKPRRQTLHSRGQLDHYPVWSPDGSHVMHVNSEAPGISRDSELVVHSMFDIKGDGESQFLTLPGDSVASLFPPVWSPDGQQIAMITVSNWDGVSNQEVLATVRIDGAEFTKIDTTTALPVWTSDGGEVVYASWEEKSPVVYAARPNGEGKRTLWRGRVQDPPNAVTHLHMSPDGSELLIVVDSIIVVNIHEGNARHIVTPRLGSGALAKWSPDGSKIAVYQRQYGDSHRTSLLNAHLFTVAPDGSNLRLVAWKNKASGPLVLAGPEEPEWEPRDTAMCSAGVVVPDPMKNPDLVKDCETLLDVRTALIGSTGEVELDQQGVQSSPLNWNRVTPIGQWEGISVGCSPLRVIGVVLPERGLTGVLPPVLGQLVGLRVIDLGNPDDPAPPETRSLGARPNRLTGTPPKALTDLPYLRELKLRNNYLSGPIAVEYWSLKGLVTRELEGNNFLSTRMDYTTNASGLAVNEIQCD